MRVQLNGAPRELPAGAHVVDALELVGVAPDEPGVAVAIDGQVVSRRDWGREAIPEGAALEIVRAAAGG